MAKELQLTWQMKSKIEGRKKTLICRRCGKPIELGQKFISRTSLEVKLPYYHKECWERLFF